MSVAHSSYSSSNQYCEWCTQQVFDRPKAINCKHIVCQECILLDKSCQSSCPCCWYTHAEQFIYMNKICSATLVCCSDISLADKSFKCPKQHYHCSQCIVQGCILCQFRSLYLWKNNKKYRDLSPNDQRVLYLCQIWETQFEEAQKSMLKNSTILQSNGIFSKEDSSSVEFDNERPFVPGSKHSQNNSSETVESGDCMVCLESLGSSYHKLDVCGHCFHKPCIDQWFQSNGKQSCPTCGHVYGISKGPQPSNGQMTIKYLPMRLAGFENGKYGYHESPTIEITYSFPSGQQGPLNPYPGRPFAGTTRKAYLPNTKEGKEILSLLRKAFDDQHIFTIGRSSTSGQDNVITWNDIHHKTSPTGGPDHYGYPDPTYLYRVRQELAAKGYK